jgi:uncharacterized protein (DUF305 family)
MHSLRILSGIAAFAGLGFMGIPAVAAADAMATPAAMMAKPVDCASASMMMEKMTPAPMMTKPDASVDRKFVDAMMAHDKMAMAMAKMEATCGKNPKARAMAQKVVEQLNVDISQLLLMTFP